MGLIRTITLLSLTLAASGCALLDFQPLGRETLKNSQGHVIGYRERLCDCKAGEELDRVVLFTPRLSQAGNVIGYEEKIKNGYQLWDTRGKRVGTRYVDLRSRGTNARNAGLTIVVRPSTEAERLAVAQVTIEEIKQYLQLSN